MVLFEKTSMKDQTRQCQFYTKTDLEGPRMLQKKKVRNIQPDLDLKLVLYIKHKMCFKLLLTFN